MLLSILKGGRGQRVFTQAGVRSAALALADLENEDGCFHDDPTIVYHRGFDLEFFRAECSKNTLTDIGITTAATIEKSDVSGGGSLYPGGRGEEAGLTTFASPDLSSLLLATNDTNEHEYVNPRKFFFGSGSYLSQFVKFVANFLIQSFSCASAFFFSYPSGHLHKPFLHPPQSS